jgi:hypothetical protein
MHARTPTALLHILLSSLLLFVIGMDSRRFVQRVSADAAIEDAATGTSSGHRLLVVVGGGAAGDACFSLSDALGYIEELYLSLLLLD